MPRKVSLPLLPESYRQNYENIFSRRSGLMFPHRRFQLSLSLFGRTTNARRRSFFATAFRRRDMTPFKGFLHSCCKS